MMLRWCTFPILVAFATVLVSAPRSAPALTLPPEDVELTQVHVQFEWAAVENATSYELWVVEDDGSPDPFVAATPVVDLVTSSGVTRAAVTSGLAFGTDYAWQVRSLDGTSTTWSSAHHFATAPIPGALPDVLATTFAGSLAPGLTMFVVRPLSSQSGYMMVVDDVGTLLWFLPGENVSDLRLLDNGRILFLADALAVEAALNGQIAWRSPSNDAPIIHHEVYPMPNGDVLALTSEVRQVSLDGETKNWVGDRAVIFDRGTNDILWSWSTFDHFSTLDFDETTYSQAGSSSFFDWTHGNGVIYVPADDSIVLSFRHLSRITRVDRSSGVVKFNVGFALPSSEAPFGDNLFSFQHAPELQANGNLLIYDNGNRRDHLVHSAATGQTKAVELSFDAAPPTNASIAWEWTLPTYNDRVGDADRLANGNTLVTSGIDATLHEVAYDGSEVWRLEMAAPGNFEIYRAERIDALLVDAPGDTDGDGIADLVDNCPDHVNPDQADCDDDGFGDTCSRELDVGLCAIEEPIPTLPSALPPLLLLVMLGLATTTLRARGRRLSPGPSAYRDAEPM